MKTTLDSISFKQYLAHEWSVKDAVDKGLNGGKAAEQNKRCSRSRAVLLSALSPSILVPSPLENFHKGLRDQPSCSGSEAEKPW